MNKYSTESSSVIPETDSPFADDLLSEGSWIGQAKSLCGFLTQGQDAVTISVKAPWGSGKTFFLQRLNTVLNSNFEKPEGLNRMTVVIDAWEFDFAPDPLIVIMDALLRTFQSRQIGGALKPALEKLKALGYSRCCTSAL